MRAHATLLNDQTLNRPDVKLKTHFNSNLINNYNDRRAYEKLATINFKMFFFKHKLVGHRLNRRKNVLVCSTMIFTYVPICKVQKVYRWSIF